MSFLVAILSHTPLFVWAIFAFLLWQGERSLHRRTRPVWSMALVPVIFGLTDFVLLARTGMDAISVLLWFAVAAMAFPLGRATGPQRIAGSSGSAVWAGSPVPLIRNLSVFAAHYAFSVAQALHPQASGMLALAVAALSGATVGYIAGWCVSLVAVLSAEGPTPRIGSQS